MDFLYVIFGYAGTTGIFVALFRSMHFDAPDQQAKLYVAEETKPASEALVA